MGYHAFKPNTSGSAAQAFLLTSACPTCIFSTHSWQNSGTASSLADNTCRILVPPTADPVIRSKTCWHSLMNLPSETPLQQKHSSEEQAIPLAGSLIVKAI